MHKVSPTPPLHSVKRPPDDATAFKWYLKSAEQGETAAMMKLSRAYRDGIGVERDDHEADRWLEKGSSQDHDLKWYFDQADAGNDAAQVELAKSYAHVGTPPWKLPLDLTEAARWYSKAANKRNNEARAALASLYETGRGVQKDEIKASALFLEGARHGHLWSQYKIGTRYEEGLGIQKDLGQAAYWYAKAVDSADLLGLNFVLVYCTCQGEVYRKITNEARIGSRALNAWE